MQTITFQCETITPMFLAGADGTTPELRAPSIKGALRFWWRAMNGHLSLPELKKREAKIFGGTEEGQGKSSIILIRRSCKEDILEKYISLTPHHKQGYCSKQNSRSTNCDFGKNNEKQYCSKASKRNAAFYSFKFEVKFDDQAISQDDLEKLLKTTFLLGGLGKRSRRGFGSCSISINDKKYFNTILDVQTFIGGLAVTSTIDYPYLKKVELGKSYKSDEEVLIAIGEATHYFKHNSLGHTQQRFASPIYVSVIKDENQNYYPIITTLNTVDVREYTTPTTPQTNFITSLKPANNGR